MDSCIKRNGLTLISLSLIKNLKLREMLDIPIFFSKVGSQMMCHNPMRLWHIYQNDRSHEIVTHHLGKKNLRCLAFP
jgi:hypothetical protein